MNENLDVKTVEGFGDEWKRFDQTSLDEREVIEEFNRYFAIFPWDSVPANATGFDLGSGSGRWAKITAGRVSKLHCIDASSVALEVARTNLASAKNVEFHNASVDSLPIEDSSMDFGYSLGVLHHVPNTGAGIKACVNKLKPGAPFLVYLYYAFDNRPAWFRAVWKVSDLLRRSICLLPFSLKKIVTDFIALIVYLPLAKLSLILDRLGFNVDVLPLSPYRNHSFYTMRTDALDRFGTRLEQRFTRQQIKEMMESAGLDGIKFSDGVPYWCAVGFKTEK